jgi:hypothetical protein
MTTRDALSLHSVECFLEKLEVARVAGFLATALDPFLFERVFGRAVGLIKNAEDAGER